MANKKEMFMKYLDMNAQKCSEELCKNIIPAFQKALDQVAQVAYREGFQKAMELVNKKQKEKNTKS